MPVQKAVIPAAGLGTRLYPLTAAGPKEMLPLGRKPAIQLVAEELARAGIDHIVVVVNSRKTAIIDHFDPGANPLPPQQQDSSADPLNGQDVTFSYTRQAQAMGLGHAIACSRTPVGRDTFVVALGDCVIKGETSPSLVERMLTVQSENEAAGVIGVQQVPASDTHRYGIIAFDREAADGDALKLSGIVEKPGPDRAPSRLAVCGRYVFTTCIFDYLEAVQPDDAGEIQLTDAIADMIESGAAVYAVPLAGSEHRLDVGNFLSYGKAFIECAFEDDEFGPALRRFAAQLADNRNCEPSGENGGF